MTIYSRVVSSWRLSFRATAGAMVVGAAITAALVGAQDAKADPTTYCSPDMPYAPYSAVCTGNGKWCYLGIACSTVPGTPGTLNPRGYTPRLDDGRYPVINNPGE